jgi:fructose-1,6-bisphosphatase II
MLFNGERIGDGTPPEVDIAVDPLEGTSLVARGQPNALAVVALAERGTMFDPGPTFYMEKIAGGDDVADLLSLTDPVEDVLARVADRRGVEVGDLMVVILDRPRHADLVARVRAVGARIRFIPDGDVAGALMAVRPGTGIDLLLGIGGTPRACWRPRRSRPPAAPSSAGSGPATTPTGAGRGRRARPGARPDDRRPRPLGQLLLRGHRRDRRRHPARRALRARHGRDAVDGHALASGTVRVLDARHQRSKLRGLAGTRYG